MRNLQFTVCNKIIVHCALCIVHSFRPRGGRNGQAAVEFVIALIALLLIVSGGVFLFNLNNAQRNMAVEMRAEAGVDALRGGYGENLDYIEDWQDNGQPRRGQAVNFNLLANYATKEPADWDRVEDLLKDHVSGQQRAQPFLVLNKNPFPMSSLGFVRISGEEPIPVENVIRQLLIPKETITVQHEVIIPSCSELY